MSFFQSFDWIWPAIALAFSLGAVATRWFYTRTKTGSKQRVNQDYFKGLNFVLNEEPDKAIEVFIKALEVDSETVELHLALGGLFRRKGQVDRATRIHQNLIARPSLTDEQRQHAIYELAQDYYKAGLLDRAENLFSELKESPTYRRRAINGLCGVYQQEKEWQKAIEVLRLHRRQVRPLHSKQVAHYWCELAEDAISLADYDNAERHLRNALSEDRSTARAILLRGELHYQKGEYAQALKLWQSLSISKPSLAELVVAKSIMSYQALGDEKGLKRFLLEGASIPKDVSAFKLWRDSLENALGNTSSIEHVFDQVQLQVHGDGPSAAAADFLLDTAEQENLSEQQQGTLLKGLLRHAKNRKIEYTCIGCGFDTKAMYWYCPNCGEWESFS